MSQLLNQSVVPPFHFSPRIVPLKEMGRIISQLSGFSKQDLGLHNFRASGYRSLNTGEVVLWNNAQYGAGSPSENTANPLNIKQLQRYNSFRKQTTVALSKFSRTATTRVGKVLTKSKRLAIPTGSEALSGPTLPGCPGSLTTWGFSFSAPDTIRRHVCAEM